MKFEHIVQIKRNSLDHSWFEVNTDVKNRIDYFKTIGVILHREILTSSDNLTKTIITIFNSDEDHNIYVKDSIISAFILNSSIFYSSTSYYFTVEKNYI